MYWFWELLCTKVHCIVPTLNLWQNPSSYHPLFYLIHLTLLGFFWSSSSVWTCNLLLSVLLCHTCSIFLSLFSSLVSYILSICVAVETSWSSIFIKAISSFPNIHGCSLSFKYCSCSCFIVMSTFCRFISLPYWGNCYVLCYNSETLVLVSEKNLV